MSGNVGGLHAGAIVAGPSQATSSRLPACYLLGLRPHIFGLSPCLMATAALCLVD